MRNVAMHQFSNLDARVVLAHIGGPYKNDAENMLWEIRRQVAMQGATTASSWQELWNTATSAAPGHPGELRFYAMTKCSNCHGRRIDMRLGTACHTCMGRGKTNTQVRFTAVYAPVPET